jgi:hypothetical protein
MSRRARRMLTYALLVGALPLLTIACPFIYLKLDVKNNTFFTLNAFNLSSTSSTDWGDNLLDGKVERGEKWTISHIDPGTYDHRASFWTKDSGVIEVYNLSDPMTFGTLNICLTYSQYFSNDAIAYAWTEVL